MLRILVDFIVLGPSCNDLIEIPKLVPAKAYQLMDICTQMFLAYACTFLASKIESITNMDANTIMPSFWLELTCKKRRAALAFRARGA